VFIHISSQTVLHAQWWNLIIVCLRWTLPEKFTSVYLSHVMPTLCRRHFSCGCDLIFSCSWLYFGVVLSFNYDLAFKASALFSFIYLLINYSTLVYCMWFGATTFVHKVLRLISYLDLGKCCAIPVATCMYLNILWLAWDIYVRSLDLR
jgi:hypothetical protein